MKKSEVVDLLDGITRYTQRIYDDPDVDGWYDAAEYNRWTYPEAAAALRMLLNDPNRADRPIQPLDVTRLVASARNERAMRAAVAERTATRERIAESTRAAIESGVTVGHLGSSVVEQLYQRRGWSPTSKAARTWRCPWCQAAAQDPCTRPGRDGLGGVTRTPLSEEHGARVALISPCPRPECLAMHGELCLGDGEHPHPERERDALGQAGLARRAATVQAALGRPAALPGQLDRPPVRGSAADEHAPPREPLTDQAHV